jgi:pimeloyl-ACP methyl ester carboxylesterase
MLEGAFTRRRVDGAGHELSLARPGDASVGSPANVMGIWTALNATVSTFVTRGGLKLAADVSADIGAGAATDGGAARGWVMLAHGGGQTRHSWASTARRLAERGWGTVSLDLRGHGDSDWDPDGDYATERYAEDLIDVAAALPGRPALIGASLGGIAGMTAEAVLAPGTFSSLTLVDIIPRADPAGVEKIIGFMGQRLDQGFATLEEAADSIAAYLPHRPRPKDLSGLRKNLRLGADGRYRWHWDPRFVGGSRRRRPDDHGADLEARCREIAIPVHLIRGRMSELVTLEAARAFVATLRDGAFTDVAGAGHMVAGDRNDVFLDAVLAFLETPRIAAAGA